MHKGKKHKEISVMEGYNDFARSEGAEAKKYVDSIRKNNPFAKGIDDMMDEESRRRERGYYVEGTVIKSPKTTNKKEQGMSRESSPFSRIPTQAEEKQMNDMLFAAGDTNSESGKAMVAKIKAMEDRIASEERTGQIINPVPEEFDKNSSELKYMPIEDDMKRGMSRESSHSIHVGTALSKGGKAIGRGIKKLSNTTLGEVAEGAVKVGKSAIEAQSGASAIKAGFKIIGGFKLPHMNKTGKSPHMHETIHKKL
jgi:hypothetical protein